MSDGEFDAERAVKILNHPVRIRIIELLASKGPLTWKELSKEVGTSTGALYHHIDMLERIVARDSSKRYVLTNLGMKVHGYLQAHHSTRDVAGLDKLVRGRSALSVVRGVLLPRTLITLLTSSTSRAVASSAGISLFVLATMFVARSRVLLLSFVPSQDPLQSVASLGVSVLVMETIVYGGTRLTGTKADLFVLLSSVTLSLLPLAVFSLLLRGLVTVGSLGALADRNVLTLAFAVFQGWGACVVGAGVSVASGLRVEKALLLSLTLLYVTVLIMFVQGLNFI